MNNWYVHYTVTLPPQNRPQHCVAGPYSLNEVIVQKRDIAGYVYVDEVYVSEESKHPKAQAAAAA